MANQLTSLPSLPKLPKKAKSYNRCECGCNGLTQSRFVPGHDARLHGWKLRVDRRVLVADGDAIAQLDWIAENASEGEAVAVARTMKIDYTLPSEREVEEEAAS